jgi:hypothetical protein
MWTVQGGRLCREWPMRPYIRGHMGHRATPGEGHTALVKRRLTSRQRRGVPRQDLQPVLLVGPRAARRGTARRHPAHPTDYPKELASNCQGTLYCCAAAMIWSRYCAPGVPGCSVTPPAGTSVMAFSLQLQLHSAADRIKHPTRLRQFLKGLLVTRNDPKPCIILVP